MNFLIQWFIFYGVMLFYSIFNNLLWINKGGEWYTNAEVSNQFDTWKGPVRDYTMAMKFQYFLGYRVLTVLTNWRDQTSAITTSLAAAVIF
jgi:hypothetical protein